MRAGGDMGYIVMKDLSMNVEDASRYCHENFNARVPRSPNEADYNLFLRHHGIINFWNSLETTGHKACVNNDCINQTYVRREDGSMLESTGQVELRMGTSPYLCSFVAINPEANSKIRVLPRPCHQPVAVVCEVFCSKLEPKYCPTSHQFAANDGKTCCNDYRRKFDPDSSPLCDGTDLLVTDPEGCCFDPIPCPHSESGCQDAPRSASMYFLPY
ncbi:uncharacterized protein LOC131879624 [Tigriopus californicus]|uniref:uncharacterized protein LOC131879624 n=1 Tax=Tigriopus californicus TaxID=6832 RepID=UPI0027DA4792|nr:uncharacterized protein LOC131879624 [Tigriopus californicus]